MRLLFVDCIMHRQVQSHNAVTALGVMQYILGAGCIVSVKTTVNPPQAVANLTDIDTRATTIDCQMQNSCTVTPHSVPRRHQERCSARSRQVLSMPVIAVACHSRHVTTARLAHNQVQCHHTVAAGSISCSVCISPIHTVGNAMPNK